MSAGGYKDKGRVAQEVASSNGSKSVSFSFNEMERAFEIADKKLDGVLKPLIVF